MKLKKLLFDPHNLCSVLAVYALNMILGITELRNYCGELTSCSNIGDIYLLFLYLLKWPCPWKWLWDNLISMTDEINLTSWMLLNTVKVCCFQNIPTPPHNFVAPLNAPTLKKIHEDSIKGAVGFLDLLSIRFGTPNFLLFHSSEQSSSSEMT